MVKGIVAALGLSLVLGCADRRAADEPQVELIPLTGRVLVDGKPAAGARVTLHPEDKSVLGTVTPHAEADAEGRFSITTYAPADGIPQGRYKATVSWCDVLNPGASETNFGPEKLPRRYQHPDASGLLAVVGNDSTELTPFELSRKR